jgi:hypothetical protein
MRGLHPRRSPWPRAVYSARRFGVGAKMGIPIVPLAWAGTKTKELKSWDQFLVPLPFGRYQVVFGDPFFSDKGPSAEDQLRSALNAVEIDAKTRLAQLQMMTFIRSSSLSFGPSLFGFCLAVWSPPNAPGPSRTVRVRGGVAGARRPLGPCRVGGRGPCGGKFSSGTARSFPGVPRLLTTTTVNGKELALRLGLAETVRLAPLDRPGSGGRFIRRARPRALVLVETEIWPYWLKALGPLPIPVVVVNGRISDGAFPLYSVAGGLRPPSLGAGPRGGSESSARLSVSSVGAHPESVAITGNLEIRRAAPGPRSRRGASWRRMGFPKSDLIWVLGSTHPGEEAMALEAFASLRQNIGGQTPAVVAPRHVERAGEIVRFFRTGIGTLAVACLLRPVRRTFLCWTRWANWRRSMAWRRSSLWGAVSSVMAGKTPWKRPGGPFPLCSDRTWKIFAEIAALFRDSQCRLVIARGAELRRAVGGFARPVGSACALGRRPRTLADSQRGALEANL